MGDYTLLSLVIGFVGVIAAIAVASFRFGRWTHNIDSRLEKFGGRIDNLANRIRALTDVFYMTLADLMGKWPSAKREKLLRTVVNFDVATAGLNSIKVEENPFTASELQRLRWYTEKAQRGEPFLVEEAQDFRQLSERAAREYAGQDWVTELLKIGLFIFAVYAIGLLESK